MIRRIMVLAGALFLGAMLSGGVAAQDSGAQGSILHEIAAAGSAADFADTRAATSSSERRASAARFSAAVISALANHPQHATAILRTAMASAPRHRKYIATTVVAAFPGYRDLAFREANNPQSASLLVRTSAQTGDSDASEAYGEPERSHEGFGLSAIVIGGGGHDVGVFGNRKESGKDVNMELRFTPFGGWLWDFILSPEPHIGGHYNTDGNTNQLYVGGTWMFDLGWGLFAGGSLGFALHDGETDTDLLDRKELGLPVLFRESLEFGYRFDEHHGLSFHLDHISNAGIDENNEGLDTFGLRYTYRI
ncbi:MAG: acyloxyacyl hydrolase [Proteobacteria bacterium]|nr:acyloxyacyl hydrolase [Pseudomonadota bacterium]MDA1355018.1 acyloxyacyl hydrolase [Pseudomonadota bacterium]